MAYLDNTGLAYFWGKIKAWANSVFALIGHKHPSSDVNAMTGYSMPASTGAISSGDTLNQAVGKLERAVVDGDISNVVHRTGDETVQGVKTFKNAHAWTTNGYDALSSIQIQSTELERNVAPIGYSRFAGVVILDKNATSDLDYVNRLGALEFQKDVNSESKIVLKTYNPDTVDGETSYFSVGWKNSISYATAPSTSSSRTNGNDILTRDWIPQDTRIVHTIGNETISGSKTFTDGITFTDKTGTETVNALYGKIATSDYFRIQAGGTAVDGGYLEIATADNGTEPIYVRQYNGVFSTVGRELVLLNADGQTHFPGNVRLKNNAVTKGTPPANNTWWNLCFSDINNTEMGSIQYGYLHNSSSYLRLGAVKHDSNAFSGFYVGFDSNQIAYATAPSTQLPSVRNEPTDIVTRDFIPNDTRIVHTTGNETISGEKKFTISPVVERANPYLFLKETDVDRTTNSGGYSALVFMDKNGENTGDVICIQEAASASPNIPINGIEFRCFAHGVTDVYRYIGFIHEGATDVWSFQTRGGVNNVRLGNGGNRFSQLYAMTATIDTSDERMKSDIQSIPEEVLDAWDDIEWYTFKMNDAVAEKGIDKARIHSGLVAQRIASVFDKHSIDAFKYSFICYDSWNAKPAMYDSEGNLVSPEEKAGDAYSLRYVEALCIEAAWQRRENSRLKKRIADLEERLAALELKIS